MDERLQAGRHHLLNGDKALHDGYLDESRSHFEAALLQFRGPELRLGEAHALRGLARVELGCGNLSLAADSARSAIEQYQEVRAILHRIDREGVSGELHRDAEEGEGAALVLLGDVLMRLGQREEARSTLSYAREVFHGLGDVPSVAGVWLAMGKLALRDGRAGQALESFQRAVAIHTGSGDVSGQVHAWLAIAEVRRLEADFSSAEEALGKAVELARGGHDEALLGRALSQQGSLMVQLNRLVEARDHFDEALPRIARGGDVEAEAFARLGLGEVASRQGQADAMQALLEGTRLLASLDNRHGLGTALLRVGHHALRVGQPALALAASECARQLWYQRDPVRGVGQALRLAVKALAALKRWPAAITAAHLRAAVAGEVQPNAIEVRDFYRARAPGSALDELDALSREQLESRAEVLIAKELEPTLAPLDLDASALGSAGGAVAVVEALHALGSLRPQGGEEELPELPDDAIEELLFEPPLEEPPPVQAVEEAAPAGPPRPTGAGTPEAPIQPPEGYEGLYEPPLDPETAAEDEETELIEDREEDEEDDDDLLEELARQALPDDYADLYSPPTDDTA